MTNYAVGIDYGGIGDEKILNDIITNLKQCSGGEVVSLGVGPSKVQNYGLTSAAKGKTGVYITNGVGLATPHDLAQSYYHYDHVIFVWPQYINNQYMSNENILNHVIPGEWDWNRASDWNVGGQTAAQWFGSNPKVDLVAGASPEDIAKRICNKAFVTTSGNPGSSGSSSSSSGGDGQSNISPLLTGDMTFEELVGEICNGIDLIFLVKRSTVVVTDFETIFAEAKYLRDNYKDSVAGEDVKLWQLEEDSYELEVNQFGFYNTVYVEYKDGVVKEDYQDFVRVYGEIPITYHDESADKSTAIMKAKAYLAAHIRELEMAVNATILSEPDIDIGDLITIENPKTMTNGIKTSQGGDAELLFVNGLSTNWEGDSYIESDLECKFAPVSPEKKEVPVSGMSPDAQTTGSGVAGNFNQCGLSADGSQIMAIGLPSASGENSYGYTFYKSVFVNKCPFCGNASLVWDWNWSGVAPCKGTAEGGTTEGHIFCKSCDADFSCIDGKDHELPPRATLTRVSGPEPSSREEAQQLKSGSMS